MALAGALLLAAEPWLGTEGGSRVAAVRRWGMAGRGTLPTLGECPHGVGQQMAAAQLSDPFAAFDDRPNQLPGAGTDLPGWCS